MANTFRNPPTVNEEMKLLTEEVDLDTTNREKIAELIVMYPDGWFSGSEDSQYFSYQRYETQIEVNKRVHEEQRALDRWQSEYNQWVADQELLKAAKKQKREARNDKYKDPQFIEFLRLQKIMIERGHINQEAK